MDEKKKQSKPVKRKNIVSEVKTEQTPAEYSQSQVLDLLTTISNLENIISGLKEAISKLIIDRDSYKQKYISVRKKRNR